MTDQEKTRMTDNEQPGTTGEEQTIAGGSTDQHVSGLEEEGTFLTDEPPASTTPASGSSNRGINELHANREDVEEDLARNTR
jgi:hypothetical protein